MKWESVLIFILPVAVVLVGSASADSESSSNPYLSIATQSERDSDWAKAEQLYLRASKDPEAHEAAVLGLARVYSGENRVADAKALLSKFVTDESPFNVDARLAYADVLRKSGDFETAKSELGSVDLLRPGTHLSWRERGMLAFDVKQMDDAVKYLSDVVQKNPDDSVARFKRAKALMTLSKPQQAVEDLNLLVQAKPSDVEYQNTLGDAYFQAGTFQDAAKTFAYSAKLSPTNPSTYERLADSEMKLARFDDAGEHYRKCVELDPYRQEAGDKLGKLYIQQNQLEKAETEYRREIQMNPNADPAAQEYVALLVEQNKIDREGEFLQEYVSHFPDKSWAATRYAKLLLSIGDMQRAEDVAKLAMDKTGSMDSMILFAFIRNSRGDKSEAQSVLSSAETKYPDQPIVKFNLALILEERGKNDDAIAEYKKIPVSSEYGRKAIVNLALLLEKTGHPQESLVALRQLKDADEDPGVQEKIAELETKVSPAPRKPAAVSVQDISSQGGVSPAAEGKN